MRSFGLVAGLTVEGDRVLVAQLAQTAVAS